MKSRIKICVIAIVCGLFLTCLHPLQSHAQEEAPILIINFEGDSPFKEFSFGGPPKEDVDFNLRFNDNTTQFIKQGGTSKEFTWNLKQGQYFGWGVDLTSGKKGLNASLAKSLTFWVAWVEGGKRFQIKLKDIEGREADVKSHKYVTINVSSEWKKVCVPLQDFEQIALTKLENMNLGFNRNISEDHGTIYFDDFNFEFKECSAMTE